MGHQPRRIMKPVTGINSFPLQALGTNAQGQAGQFTASQQMIGLLMQAGPEKSVTQFHRISLIVRRVCWRHIPDAV
jgi:hypothetical protein